MSRARPRRLLIVAGLLLFALLGALAAGAQPQPAVVGRLAIGSPADFASRGPDLFIDGLRELGYKDGESIVIETRWAHGDITRYPTLARDLIQRRPAVIFAPCGPSLRAIREITRTLPVIAICADERNFLGEVASLSRPGGFTTGMTFLSPESVGKRLELLREILPRLSRLAVLYEPNDPIDAHWRELERLQPKLGLAFQRVPVGRADELEAAFETIVRERAHAVFVFPTNRMIAERVRIAELARRHSIATVFELSFHVEAGGLLSYGASVSEFLGKTAPMYVDKILRGAKPAELPIVQPTRFELVVNLKTARAIGIKVPQSILQRADRVIE
jgi:putative ABC transport system substrate-binding protein